VVIRFQSRPERDIAYVGGIDLCHARRDDARHLGDPQPQPMAEVYGETPPWHDVQAAIAGPGVYDVETVFRERWQDPTPLSRNPVRRLRDRLAGEDTSPNPLPAQAHQPRECRRCISELRRLPWATVNVLPFNSLGKDLAPLAFGLAPARGRLGRMRDVILWQAFGAATLPFKRAYNQARIQVGLATDPCMYGVGLVSPWLVLATGCPSLERPGAELPNQIHYVGRLSPSGGKSGSTIPPSADPHVIVTQGTHHVELTDLIQPAIEGLCELDVSVVATTGRRGHTDIGVEVPQNAQIVDFLDFRSVLPAASVFVTNGGWGGVLASLAAGVPLVIAGGDIDKASDRRLGSPGRCRHQSAHRPAEAGGRGRRG
jgi:Erythromycin biosynthesis protein CIII-like, C-terminal domain